MKCTVLLCLELGSLVFGASVASGQLNQAPDLGKLESVSDYEVSPKFLAGIALHKREVWGTVYQNGSIYASFDRQRQRWIQKPVPNQGGYGSGGGACIVAGKLWVASTDGVQIARYDLESMKRDRQFRYPQTSEFSQSFGGLAFDGRHLWAEWQTLDKKLPASRAQVLFKLSPETGKVLARYPAPTGNRFDVCRGLEWDGSVLWLAHDKSLTAIDPRTGRHLKTYTISELHRPSGLAWDGQGLWIGEFTGRLWRLPFRRVDQSSR